MIIFCKLSEYIPTSTRSMYLFYLLSLISLETSISYNFLLSLPHTISRKHKDDTMGEGRRVPCPLYPDLMGVVANGLIQPEMQRTHFNEFMLIFLTRKSLYCHMQADVSDLLKDKLMWLCSLVI